MEIFTTTETLVLDQVVTFDAGSDEDFPSSRPVTSVINDVSLLLLLLGIFLGWNLGVHPILATALYISVIGALGVVFATDERSQGVSMTLATAFIAGYLLIQAPVFLLGLTMLIVALHFNDEYKAESRFAELEEDFCGNTYCGDDNFHEKRARRALLIVLLAGIISVASILYTAVVFSGIQITLG